MSLLPVLEAILATDPVDLAELALVIARLETPHLDPAPTHAALRALGDEAKVAVDALGPSSTRARLAAVNAVLFGPLGFRGNTAAYDDVRNSLLHVVVNRRLGIPITLAIVYISVARRAGVDATGVSFPGHFLMRVPADAAGESHEPIVLDPFDAGRELSQPELEARLRAHTDGAEIWKDSFLEPATSRQIAVRLVNNLKRLYVSQRSFEQAWQATDLLVALDEGAAEHLRDRGLLAYHVDRFADALADLEAYVKIIDRTSEDAEQRSQLWEHITSLRKRVAAMN